MVLIGGLVFLGILFRLGSLALVVEIPRMLVAIVSLAILVSQVILFRHGFLVIQLSLVSIVSLGIHVILVNLSSVVIQVSLVCLAILVILATPSSLVCIGCIVSLVSIGSLAIPLILEILVIVVSLGLGLAAA